MQLFNNRRTKKPTLSLLLGLGAIAVLSVIVIAPATAQEGIPDGAECIRFELDPTPDVFAPGDRDVVLLMLQDGTQVLFSDVVSGQRLESPTDSLIVTMYKCELPEETVTPEPTPEPTPVTEPTPDPTPAAEPTPEPTAEPTPEPTTEATPAAEPSAEPTTLVAPQPTPSPDVEVLGTVQDRDGELASTGFGSGPLVAAALGLIAVGLFLRRLEPAAR